ncbi:hypothetical protein LJC61_06065 [Ruminococcaceae bacterium OttesenSCG-928-A16]|nr:hypothetical protein [Ruminococcaceae bacterium OttesenSCG-928-A16]
MKKQTAKKPTRLIAMALAACISVSGLVVAGQLQAQAEETGRQYGTVLINNGAAINFINGSFEEPPIGSSLNKPITTTPGTPFKPGGVQANGGDSEAVLKAGWNQFYAKNAITTNDYTTLETTFVPGWATRPTNPNSEEPRRYFIEIQHKRRYNSGNYTSSGPARPHSGDQYAELNADEAGTIYQLCNTVPGQKVYYTFYHTGRNGEDVMNFYLRAPGNTTTPHILTCADESYDWYTKGAGKNTTSYTGSGTPHPIDQGWGYYVGAYYVPEGQEITEFAFEAVSSYGGQKYIAQGNYLDDISLFYPSFLKVDKEVITPESGESGQYASVGDTVTYQITITNIGETASSYGVLMDSLPKGFILDADNLADTAQSPVTVAVYDAEGTLISTQRGGGLATFNKLTADKYTTGTLRVNFGRDAKAALPKAVPWFWGKSYRTMWTK